MGLTKKNIYKKPEYTIETSWDDGGEQDPRIATLLQNAGIPGTFYVVIDNIGIPGFMSWDQIKELDKQGFKIGSHTVSHPPDLKKCFDDELHLEIQSSKDLIETALGHHITSFCYPRGRFDDRIKNKVIEAGYLTARTTGKPGNLDNSDPFALPGTIHIFQRPEYGDKSILDFAKETIDRVTSEGGYCNIWGHSAEIEKNNLWNVLEQVLNYVKEKTN